MSDPSERTNIWLSPVGHSRWPVALLIAVAAHTLVIVCWLGIAANEGARFGNEGVHVGLSVASSLDIPPLTELFEEAEVDETPNEQPITWPEIPAFQPLLTEDTPPELPDPDFEPILQEANSFGIPSFEVPLAVLDLQRPQPTQSVEQSGSGQGNSNQFGSSDRISNSYMVRVSAHLNRFKRYPKTSRRAKEEGEAVVTFTIYAQGNVDSISLAKSSGFVELDEEALRMVRRAAPFPKIPNTLRKQGIDDLQIRSSIKFSIKE